MIEAITKLSHKDDWETPPDVLRWAELVTGIKPEIDACANEQNAKCTMYISPEQDLFKADLPRDFFYNPPYRKKGWVTTNKGKANEVRTFNETGIEDFIRYCTQQHIKHNVNALGLFFSNISSSGYFTKYIGNTPEQRIANHAELYFCAIDDFNTNSFVVGGVSLMLCAKALAHSICH